VKQINYELKPCPFCGRAARLLVVQQNGVCVKCLGCGVQTPWTDDMSHGLLKDWENGYVNSIELSIHKWNRRAYDE
jgi:hypothetical protein